MKDILEKLTTYNLFNYFLPGLLFSVVGSSVTNFNLVHEDLVLAVFVFYFIGLVISRIGSLFIEPILKKLSFLKFSDYEDFVHAAQKDSRIEEFSEVNNMYRTLTTMLLMIIVLKIYDSILINYGIHGDEGTLIAVVLLSVLFLFSYKKQTSYITKRINIHTKKHD